MGGAAPPRQPSPDHPRQTLQGNDGSTPLTSTTGQPLVQLDPAKLIKSVTPSASTGDGCGHPHGLSTEVQLAISPLLRSPSWNG